MDKFIRRSISFHEDDLKILERKDAELKCGISGAVRIIIREWAEMKKQYVTIPVKGFIDDLGRVVYSPEKKDE